MIYKRISRANEPITLQEAKDHLRVTHDLEDGIITSLVLSALEWAEGYTGRAFSEVVVEAVTEEVSDTYSLAMYLPIATVDSVIDANGDPVAYDFTYPSVVNILESLFDDQYPLKITYTSSVDVPEPVRSAMMLRIGDLYDYRTDRYVPLNREGMYRKVAEEMLQAYKLLGW